MDTILQTRPNTKSDLKTIRYPLLFELTVWTFGAVGFLGYYAYGHGAPYSAIGAHLSLVLIWFMTTAGVRILCSLLPIGKTTGRLISIIVILSSLVLLWAYYVVAATGLVYWGRIPSIGLLQSYSGSQLLGLLQAIGVPVWLAAGSVSLVLIILGLLVWQWLLHYDWSTRRPANITSLTWGIIGGALLIISIAEVSNFIGDPPISDQEPFALTLFPERVSNTIQGLEINGSISNTFDDLAEQERQSYAPLYTEPRKNLILFVVDGLRPDRMGVFGTGRNTTPFLSFLNSAGQIRIKGRLHAVCAESTCGLLALNSSVFPHQFSSEPFTFTEALRMHGYEIYMLLSGDHTSFYGLKNYYGETDLFLDGNDATGHYINDDLQLLNFVERLPPSSGNPVMIQFHLMSSHNLGSRWLEETPFQPSTAYTLRGLASQEEALNYYDNGVYQTDRMIQLLVDKLEDKGYLRNAAVGITADHGEALGEHGYWSHSNTLREPSIKIPFILIPELGSQASGPHSDVVGSQVDVAPTIMDMLHLPIPQTWRGKSLLKPQTQRMIHIRQRHEIGVVHFDKGDIWKYWADTRTGEEHVYDLMSDPSEQKNLVSRISPELLAKWRLAILPAIGSVDSSRFGPNE